VTGDPEVTAKLADTPDIASGTPLPALGYVLGVCWLLVISMYPLLAPRGTIWSDRQHLYIPAAIVGALVMVVPPLLLPQIPTVRRLQALPFLVLAGLVFIVPLLITGPSVFALSMLSPLVLYGIGWMRLRGRPPLLLLATLATPVLGLLGRSLASLFALRFDPPRYNDVGARSEAFSGIEQALVTVVLPICLPVLATGLARFRHSFLPAVALTPTIAPVDPQREWNGLAAAALVVGVAGGGPIAVVLGHMARRQTRRLGQRGAGLAAAGLVLGYLGTAAAWLLWMFAQALSGIGE
jgi:hypothetical protein